MACCLLPQGSFGITILTLTATTCQGIVRRQALTSLGKHSETHTVASYRRMDSVFGSIKVRLDPIAASIRQFRAADNRREVEC